MEFYPETLLKLWGKYLLAKIGLQEISNWIEKSPEFQGKLYPGKCVILIYTLNSFWMKTEINFIELIATVSNGNKLSKVRLNGRCNLIPGNFN